MSILHNVNYMKRFVFHPCATPNPLIVIETAFEAAAAELWEFFSFQLPQILNPLAKKAGSQNAPKWYPAPARYTDPSRRGKGHGRHITQDPPGRTSPGEKWGPNTIAFRAVDAEQKAMFYWMVVDLATEFMARWTTLLYLKQDCPFDHNCHKQGPFDSIFIGQGTVVCILPMLNAGTIFSGGFEIQQITFPDGDGTVSNGSMTVETTLAVFNGTKPPTAAWVEIREVDTGKTVAGGPGGTPSDDNLSLKTGATYSRPAKSPPHSYNVVLVNQSTTEDVAVVAGVLHISGGFCVSVAPAQPFDVSHILPRIGPR